MFPSSKLRVIQESKDASNKQNTVHNKGFVESVGALNVRSFNSSVYLEHTTFH
jgi:hypothetical protein